MQHQKIMIIDFQLMAYTLGGTATTAMGCWLKYKFVGVRVYESRHYC